MTPLFCYDIETYPNCFTAVFKEFGTDNWWEFDHNQIFQFLQMLEYIKSIGGRMVGYNNVAFDYPVIHRAIIDRQAGEVTPEIIYAEVERNFAMEKFDRPIRKPDVPQVDLYLIHHFDNMAKATTLKDIEFVLGLENIQDLPFEPGRILTLDEQAELKRYNRNDVHATEELLKATMEQIEFRDELGPEYTNYNDVRVGLEILADKLHPDRKARTPRHSIALNDVIFPIVKFARPEFQHILADMRSRTIYPQNAKGALSGLTTTIDDLHYHFGVGGLHASVPAQTVRADDEYTIIDLDVASYYPNLATSHEIYPEHIGPKFCEVYREMYEIRKKYPKGSTLNQAMKLALNGSFGKTGSEYSWLYDPQYTFTITVNGQLLLAMFCEWVLEIEGLSVIQANTDGITVRLPRKMVGDLEDEARSWEKLTGLVLEDVEYDSMWIRDVNNYVARTVDGKLKRKGAYEYEKLPFNKDHSMLVVPKCAEKVLVHGMDPVSAVVTHDNVFDFMIRSKVRRTDKTIDNLGNEYQRINRFIVTTDGVKLSKITPPTGKKGDYKKASGVAQEMYDQLNQTGIWNPVIHTKNKSVYDDGISVLAGGRNVTVCNQLPFEGTIDYTYYINEVKKLTEPLK